MQGHYTPTDEDIERFWSRVDRTCGDNACCQWMAGLHAKGYGRLRWNKVDTAVKPKTIHHILYSLSGLRDDMERIVKEIAELEAVLSNMIQADIN